MTVDFNKKNHQNPPPNTHNSQKFGIETYVSQRIPVRIETYVSQLAPGIAIVDELAYYCRHNMRRQFPIHLLCLAGLLFAPGCSSPVRYDRPKEWIVPGSADALIELYRPVLTGRRIFLDPGHGGEDRVSHGPAGMVVEADVNLSVALQLRSFLQRAGAVVMMSRQKDTTVSLRDRPRLAVAAGAEIFISLHHNDTGSRDNVTNYSSVYYHSVEGRPDYFPPNHDLARYIERDMAYAMRDPEPPSSPTFDGTLSDFTIYPNAGFAVLRDNPLPAVLIEGSFFSHPYEEQRLAIREFNEIEAWGIFLGVGKYFRAGIPELKLLSDSIESVPRPTLKLLAGPRGDIDSTSVAAWIDSEEVRVPVPDSTGIINVTPGRELTSGYHVMRVEVKNLRGNSSWPFVARFTEMLPVARLALNATPESLPPDRRTTTRITLSAVDHRGHSVADGSSIHLSVRGVFQDTTLRTMDGFATIDLHAPDSPGVLNILAHANACTGYCAVPVSPSPDKTYIEGVIRSAPDSLAITDAVVGFSPRIVPDSAAFLAFSGRDGRFFAYHALPDSISLMTISRGYFTRSTRIGTRAGFTKADLFIAPVAGKRLFGATVVIDPRFGGSESGDVSGLLRSSDINLAIAQRLGSLLRASGASPVLARDHDTTISEHDRSTFSGRQGRGVYLRIDASGRAGRCSSEIYPNPANAIIAGTILSWVHRAAGLDSASISGGQTPFFREVAQSTISIVVPSVTSGYFDTQTGKKIDDLAWGLYRGLLDNAGFTGGYPGKLRAVGASGSTLPNSPFVINGVFTRYSDSAGNLDLFGLIDSTANVTTDSYQPFHLIPIPQ